MTFGDWVDSSYNTDGYAIDTDNNYIQYPYDPYVYVVYVSGGGFSTSTDIIESNYEYGLES